MHIITSSLGDLNNTGINAIDQWVNIFSEVLFWGPDKNNLITEYGEVNDNQDLQLIHKNSNTNELKLLTLVQIKENYESN